jgi:hypothetical protein
VDSFCLLIDDIRGVDHVGEMDHIARTAPEGRKALLAFPVTHLILDNDLGPEQDMEGIEILQWAFERGCVPAKVSIISSNTPAKARMEALLLHDMKYTYNRGTGWWS